MGAIRVAHTSMFDAIQATDPEAEEVLGEWVKASDPSIAQAVALLPPNAIQQKVWFIRDGHSEIAIIHPADFAAEFTQVGTDETDMAQFEALLAETARVEQETNAEGLTPQQVIDNYIGERIALMMDKFETLHVEQETNEGMDAMGAVKAAFMDVFGVTEGN